MTSRARELYEEALTLPVGERAALAEALLASLDGEADPDAHAAWDREIARRAEEALSAPEDDIAWESVRADLVTGRLAPVVRVR